MEKCAYCEKEFSLLSRRQEKRIEEFQKTHGEGNICDPCISTITQAEFKAMIAEMIKNQKNEIMEAVANEVEEVYQEV
jgi:gas vesicle protein